MSKKIKVLHIIPDFGCGGAEKVVLTYMQCLRNDCDIVQKVLVLSSNKNRLYEKIVEKEKLDFVFLDQKIDDRCFFSRLKQIHAIRRFIKDYKPTIVHMHLSILWLICLSCFGVKIKFKFHTLHSDPEVTSCGKNRYIDRFCYKFFKVRPICLNEEMKRHADRIFHRNNTLILHNGIQVGDYIGLKNKKNLRRELGIGEYDYVVGHVGRFEKVKNHVKIINVFEKLKEMKPNSKLVLIGDGSTFNYIREIVVSKGLDSYVVFAGTRADIPQVMQIFDSFIFPSLYEGLGIVMLEAQAAHLHCVMSSGVPVEVVVSNSVSVLDINESDVEWANELVAPKYLYPQQKTLAEYSIEYVLKRLKEIYRGEF